MMQAGRENSHLRSIVPGVKVSFHRMSEFGIQIGPRQTVVPLTAMYHIDISEEALTHQAKKLLEMRLVGIEMHSVERKS